MRGDPRDRGGSGGSDGPGLPAHPGSPFLCSHREQSSSQLITNLVGQICSPRLRRERRGPPEEAHRLLPWPREGSCVGGSQEEAGGNQSLSPRLVSVRTYPHTPTLCSCAVCARLCPWVSAGAGQGPQLLSPVQPAECRAEAALGGQRGGEQAPDRCGRGAAGKARLHSPAFTALPAVKAGPLGVRGRREGIPLPIPAISRAWEPGKQNALAISSRS